MKFKPYTKTELVSALNYVINEIKEGWYDEDYSILQDRILTDSDISDQELTNFNSLMIDAYTDNESEDGIEEDRSTLYFNILKEKGIIAGDEELDENGINGLEAVGLEKDVMDEQEGRTFALTQRGKNLITLMRGLPRNILLTLQTMGADNNLDTEKSITDTYLQGDIVGGATIEELIKAKVIFKLEDNNPTENIMENKNKQAEIAKLTKQIEEATGKKVVLQEAEKVSSTSVGDLTVEEIIPAESAAVMQEYVSATLKELKSKIAELETIKFDVSPQARASAEDWKAKTENVQFSIKQLERISRFVNNTLTAKKFDKNILDKLIALTPEEDTATSTPAMDMSTPPMDMGTDLGASTDLGTDLGADAGLPPM